ncbi:hypothetical protein KFE98_17605 [bacterium SCSIO 12741]|nr:hypothetical protein KFE98_17605 [bacterium SCSIO 12741]
MKSLFSTLVLACLTAFVFAQAPGKISYQSVIRLSDHTLLTNQKVTIDISLLSDTVGGVVVYEETHNTRTNDNGLVSLEIGSGIVISGDFSTIDWSAGPYFIKTVTNATGIPGDTVVGVSQLLSVPYALHAQTATLAGSLANGEQDPQFNQSLAAGITSADTSFWNQKTVDTQIDSAGIAQLGFVAGAHTVNTDNQTLSLVGDSLRIAGGNTIDLSSIDTQLDSTDIANLGFTAGPKTIDTKLDSAGIAAFGYVAGPKTVDTDDQTLSLSGTTLSIADGNSVNLASIDTDTKIDSAGIAAFGFVAGPKTTDTDDQTLSLSGTTLSIADGNSVNLASIDTDTKLDSTDIAAFGFVAGAHTIDTDTDDQTLSLSGNTLSIADGNSVDLSSFANTDAQTLTFSAGTLAVSGGNSVYIPATTDTDDQTLSLSGNTLSIADGNSVDLSPFANTDAQTLTFSAGTLAVSGGNSVFIPATTDTDDQTLSLSGTTLSIADGNSVNLSSINTDTQLDSAGVAALGFVAGAHTVDTDTDDQTLSLSGNSLSIADGNSVDLSSFANTDNQTLTFSAGTLAVSGGNSVFIPSTTDTDDQTLSLSGNSLSIADGNSVDLSSFANTDAQTLTFSAGTLAVSGGNSVYIPTGVDTDDQTLSLSGSNLSIADGNSVDLSSIDTKLDSAGIAALGYVAGSHTAGSDKQMTFNDGGKVGADAELVYDKSKNHMAIGTSTINNSAALEIKSTSGALLMPRMTTVQRDSLTAEIGMMIFNIDSGKFQGYSGFTGGTEVSFDHHTFKGNLTFSGQSFTAVNNGQWTKIELDFQTGGSDTLKIYNGHQTSNNPIHVQPITVGSGQQTIVLSKPIPITAGQQYAFSTNMSCGYYPFGTYGGGSAFTVGLSFPGDLWFKILTGKSQWENLH